MILLIEPCKDSTKGAIMKRELLEVKGRIFDIQKYSIHDGPGIRTVVFLKGCPLRCQWCCNPESQNIEIQTMKVNGKDQIIGRDTTVSEVIDDIKKDMVYYRRSGGGLTLSGGEVLFQSEFATALLEVAKYNNIHTTIESTGFAKYERIEELLPYLDLYLMDIKHMNSAKHKAFIGQPNDLILENARKIANTGKDLIIRVPIIPTFNHLPEEIYEIAKFAKSLSGVKELHLLAYHRLGQDKYEGLGRDYSLANIEPLSNAYMLGLKEVAETTGLQVKIGG